MDVIFCGKTSTPIRFCKLHQHNCWEIILYMSGNVIAQVDNESYNVSEGDILVIPPNVQHNGIAESLYTDIYVQCTELDIKDVKLFHDYDGAVHILMNLLHKNHIENDKYRKRVDSELLRSIVAYLDKYDDSECKNKVINSLKSEIYNNFSKSEFDISSAVKDTGFHVDYIRRKFKEEIGSTPLEYLTTMRMNYAKALLRQEPFTSVEEVAEKCGYSDSFYFSRLFKKHFGESPLKYRKSRF